MKEQGDTFSLEENFVRLENMIDKMSDEELPLEEAFQLYSQGINVLKQCNEQIDRVEKQVLKLTAGGQLEVFENAEQ